MTFQLKLSRTATVFVTAVLGLLEATVSQLEINNVIKLFIMGVIPLTINFLYEEAGIPTNQEASSN